MGTLGLGFRVRRFRVIGFRVIVLQGLGLLGFRVVRVIGFRL